MQWYLEALKRYFDFKGRSSRKAFWMFVAFNILFTWVAIALDNLLGTTGYDAYLMTEVKYGAFHNFYSIFIIIPSTAILIRRLHDIGKKWSVFFVIFIPVFGQIWMLIMMLKPGEAYTNEYGPVPHDGFASAHPYNEPNVEDQISITEQPEIMPLPKAKMPKIKKQKNGEKKGFWIQDRGAVDFTKPSKKKRKT